MNQEGIFYPYVHLGLLVSSLIFLVDFEASTSLDDALTCIHYCQMIAGFCQHLCLPLRVMNTACSFFQRYHLRMPWDIEPRSDEPLTVFCCVLLACKSEDPEIKPGPLLDEFVQFCPNYGSHTDLSEKWPSLEIRILAVIDFSLHIELPHTYALIASRYLFNLNQCKNIDSKNPIRKFSSVVYDILTAAAMTPLSLFVRPQTQAVIAFFVASLLYSIDLNSCPQFMNGHTPKLSNSEHWFDFLVHPDDRKYFESDLSPYICITHAIMEFSLFLLHYFRISRAVFMLHHDAPIVKTEFLSSFPRITPFPRDPNRYIFESVWSVVELLEKNFPHVKSFPISIDILKNSSFRSNNQNVPSTNEALSLSIIEIKKRSRSLRSVNDWVGFLCFLDISSFVDTN